MSSVNLQYLRQHGGVIKLQGKEFVTFSGLLAVAHSNGLTSITPLMLDWNAAEKRAIASRAGMAPPSVSP